MTPRSNTPKQRPQEKNPQENKEPTNKKNPPTKRTHQQKEPPQQKNPPTNNNTPKPGHLFAAMRHLQQDVPACGAEEVGSQRFARFGRYRTCTVDITPKIPQAWMPVLLSSNFPPVFSLPILHPEVKLCIPKNDSSRSPFPGG